MKSIEIIILTCITFLSLVLFFWLFDIEKQHKEICTYSLNAYPQDSITYYRLGCHVEGFED